MSSELLTINSVARILKLHPDTVRRYILEGKIPSIKLAYNAVRISREALDKFVKDREQPSADLICRKEGESSH